MNVKVFSTGTITRPAPGTNRGSVLTSDRHVGVLPLMGRGYRTNHGGRSSPAGHR